MYNDTECERHKYHGHGPCEDCEMSEKLFLTWRFNSIKFIGINLDGRVHIADEKGNNYGAWIEVSTFRERQQSGGVASWVALGKARLMVCPT